MARAQRSGFTAARSSRSVDELLGEVRARGHRMTPQRQLIFETVYTAKKHLTAEEIHERVRKRFRGVNLSTVYRNLDLLEDLGLICHAHLGHSVGQYHPTSGVEHQHLVCRVCGSIEEVGVQLMEPVRKQVLSRSGFEADLTHFAIFGICRRCRS
ncbi:MAG: transcriptional repressor [Actinobacteria bacterium]|nr:MAG: transcriptional repressor [Actinomycetota bacterium]